MAHDTIGGWWWYGSRSWTFSSVSHAILLPCDRLQQRGTLTEWCLTWKCIWSKGVELNSSTRKKKAAIDIHCHLLNVDRDQTVDVSTVREWEVRFTMAVATVVHLFWYRFLQAWHAALVHYWLKGKANGGDYVEKWCFGDENLHYQIVLLCSFICCSFHGNK